MYHRSSRPLVSEKPVIVANVLDQDENVIGNIERDGARFRVSWRARMDGAPGNMHTFERESQDTFEEARQAVWRVDANAMIVEVPEGGT
jgi:hypothetical protein